MTTFTLATGHHSATGMVQSGCPFTTVVIVRPSEPADIQFCRYTKDFSDLNSRPYVLTKSRRQFKTLKAAVAALKKERQIG